jgi:hypothetical protein
MSDIFVLAWISTAILSGVVVTLALSWLTVPTCGLFATGKSIIKSGVVSVGGGLATAAIVFASLVWYLA